MYVCVYFSIFNDNWLQRVRACVRNLQIFVELNSVEVFTSIKQIYVLCAMCVCVCFCVCSKQENTETQAKFH